MGWLEAALGANLQPMKPTTMNKANPIPKVKLIKLSADVHRKDFKICRQIGDQNLQPAQVFDPAAAVQWALKQLASAERVVFCYEAGFSGFSLARQLARGGVEPLVICAQRLDERCKKVTTDRRDATAIGGRLDRYLAGNQEALVPVRIPTEVEEDERAVSRQRGQMLKARKQFEAQGRSLLHFKGRACPTGWWRGSEVQWQRTVQTEQWPASLVARLAGYRRLALTADLEVSALTVQLENEAAQHLPPGLTALPTGFGKLSLEILRREVCDYQRFKNRGNVGSFFGLCCSESSSGERPHQGSITKTGNPRCRHALVELAWRALQFQPDYWLVKKYQPRLTQAKARSVARKKIIVALARLIGVDLWRLYTGQTTPAKLGLRLNTGGKDYVLKTA
jgi:transposase